MSWARGSGAIADHGGNYGYFVFYINSTDNSVKINTGTSIPGITSSGGTGSATDWYEIHG